MKPLIERLRQRKIVQWALAYLAGAWVFYQLLDAFGEPWGVSNGFFVVVQVLLFAGFFVALTLAWYHGERGEQRVTGIELLILAGVMGLGGIGVLLVRAPERPTEPAGFLVWVSGDATTRGDIGPRDRGQVYFSDDRMWYRPWSSPDAAPIQGTDGVTNRWMSNDGRLLAFNRRGDENAWLVDIPDGTPREVMAARGHAVMGVLDDGTVYVLRDRRLFAADAGDDSLRAVTTLADGDVRHRRPAEVAGRDILLFEAYAQTGAFVEAVDLESRAQKRIVAGSWPTFLSPNFLVYLQSDGRLMAARFDTRELTLSSEAIEVASGVGYYDLSTDGDLVINEGSSGDLHELVWVDPSGQVEPVDSGWAFDHGGGNAGWRLSPSGDRIALRIAGVEGHDIWIKHLQTGALERLTFDPGRDMMPRWKPDGSTVTFISDRLGGTDLWEVSANGVGEPRLLADLDSNLAQGFYTPSGDELLLRTSGGDERPGEADILVQPAQGERILAALLDSDEWDEATPALSSQGTLLAYVSDETGQTEVYLRSYPDVGQARWRVSTDYGTSPVWSLSGRDLYFKTGRLADADEFLVVAHIDPSQSNPVTGVDTLFSVRGLMVNSAYRDFYDVAPDGRFLFARPLEDGLGEAREVFVQNVREYLERNLPR